LLKHEEETYGDPKIVEWHEATARKAKNASLPHNQEADRLTSTRPLNPLENAKDVHWTVTTLRCGHVYRVFSGSSGRVLLGSVVLVYEPDLDYLASSPSFPPEPARLDEAGLD